jgi:hypothetical protein
MMGVSDAPLLLLVLLVGVGLLSCGQAFAFVPPAAVSSAAAGAASSSGAGRLRLRMMGSGAGSVPLSIGVFGGGTVGGGVYEICEGKQDFFKSLGACTALTQAGSMLPHSRPVTDWCHPSTILFLSRFY